MAHDKVNHEKKDTEKKAAGFINMGDRKNLNPADIIPSSNNLLSNNDKSKQLEKSHDMISNLFSTEKVKSLSVNDTEKLLDKQSQLMDQMKSMTPFISQAMGILDKIDLNKILDTLPKMNN